MRSKRVEPAKQRFAEELFFLEDVSENELLFLHDLRVNIAHYLDDDFGDFAQEGVGEAQLATMHHGAAHHSPQHVAAPLVAGRYAFAEEEGGGAGVVGDHAIGDDMLLALFVGVAG